MGDDLTHVDDLYDLTFVNTVQVGASDNRPRMSAVYGLPLIGVLLMLLVMVRDVARKDRLRRRKRERESERFYWERTSDPSEPLQMREDSHQTTVMDNVVRTGSRSTEGRHKP